MRKIMSWFICFIMLFSMTACIQVSDQSAVTTKEVETTVAKTEEKILEDTIEKNVEQMSEKVEEKTEEEEIKYPTVEDPLTPEKLAAIPIANSSMTIDELRQICIDYFRLQLSFTFVPSQDYHYMPKSSSSEHTLKEGILFGGLPYVSQGSGNLYRVLEYYDVETGILDMSDFLECDARYFGNACSGGAYTGWNRVVNSAEYTVTYEMTQANGFIPVGPYTYDENLETIGEKEGDYSSKEIVAENGQQTMYESYALTHKADGLVNPDHVIMIVEEPVIVRNNDGTINGEKSYIVCCEQILRKRIDKYKRVQSDGTEYYADGGIDVQFTFAKLFETSYIPFTFAEFLGIDPVEEATCALDITSPTVTLSKLSAATVVSNYSISDIFVVIRDAEGKQLFESVSRKSDFYEEESLLVGVIKRDKMQQYANGNNTIEISCQLYNGQKLVAYTGTLVE